MTDPFTSYEKMFEVPAPLDIRTPVDIAAIARSARVLPDGRLEIQRYIMGGVRLTLLAVAVMWCVMAIGGTWASGVSPLDHFRIMFDPEPFYSASYDDLTELKGAPLESSRAEFIASSLQDGLHQSRVETAVAVTGPLFALVAAFFLWPRPAPLYVDRGRRAVYTKRNGRLIAKPINGGTVDLNAALRPAINAQRSMDWGPLVLELTPLTGGKPKRTWVGVSPASHPAQHENLFHAIRSFAGARTTPPWVAELETHRAKMRPSPLRAIFMGFVLRRRIRTRDLARIEAWRTARRPSAT